VARVWPSYDNTETAYYCISGCVGDFPQLARQRRDEQGIYSKRLSRDSRAKSDVLNYTKAHHPTRLDKTVLSRRVWRCELSITWFPKVPFQNLLSPPISAERKLSGNPGAQKSQQRQAGDSGVQGNQEGSGTFGMHPLFPGLRGFVYLVRTRDAGRRDKLMCHDGYQCNVMM